MIKIFDTIFVSIQNDQYLICRLIFSDSTENSDLYVLIKMHTSCKHQTTLRSSNLQIIVLVRYLDLPKQNQNTGMNLKTYIQYKICTEEKINNK